MSPVEGICCNLRDILQPHHVIKMLKYQEAPQQVATTTLYSHSKREQKLEEETNAWSIEHMGAKKQY